MISRGCVLGASDSAVNSLFLSLPLPPNNLRAWVVLAARIAAALTPPRRMLLLTVLALFLYKNGQNSSKKGEKRIFLPKREKEEKRVCVCTYGTIQYGRYDIVQASSINDYLLHDVRQLIPCK